MDFSSGNNGNGKGNDPPKRAESMEEPAMPKRRWVTRREAAVILGCSPDNVRRMERNGQLHSQPDRNGTSKLDRLEVEARAAERGRKPKISGPLTARVFRMFKAKVSFADICIETEQDADTILRLWRQYTDGFEAAEERVDDEAAAREERARREREQREYDEEVRALDEELERRRHKVFGDRQNGEPTPPASTNGKKPRSGGEK